MQQHEPVTGFCLLLLECLSHLPLHPNPSAIATATAKSLQSCSTLCDPIDGSPLGSPIPGILQARTLEWVAISFSNAWKWKVKVKSLSCVWLFATPWTAAHQAPLSMGFSRQEYWSGVPLPSPPTPLGCHKALIWVPWVKLWIHCLLTETAPQVSGLTEAQVPLSQHWKDSVLRQSHKWR